MNSFLLIFDISSLELLHYSHKSGFLMAKSSVATLSYGVDLYYIFSKFYEDLYD